MTTNTISTTTSPVVSPVVHEQLLTAGEVAARFHVDPRTVSRWAQQGKLTCLRTLGGHRRYLDSEVTRLLENR